MPHNAKNTEVALSFLPPEAINSICKTLTGGCWHQKKERWCVYRKRQWEEADVLLPFIRLPGCHSSSFHLVSDHRIKRRVGWGEARKWSWKYQVTPNIEPLSEVVCARIIVHYVELMNSYWKCINFSCCSVLLKGCIRVFCVQEKHILVQK